MATNLTRLPLVVALMAPAAAWGLSDPTEPPVALRQAQSPAPAPGQGDAPGETAPRPSGLQLILAGERSPVAVIDGQVVEEGGWVGGARLVKIHADSVMLSGPQGKQTLRLPGFEKPPPHPARKGRSEFN